MRVLTIALEAMAALAVVVTLVAFWIDLVGRTEERIARAWQLVTTKAPGNSGKIEALEYLNSEDWWWPFKHRVPLVGIDLSAESNGGNAVYLMGVDLRHAFLFEADLSGANLISASLDSANLNGTRMDRTMLFEASLNGATIAGANLSGTILLDAGLQGADLTSTKLTGANMRGAKLMGANLDGANLSGATLSGADLSDTHLTRANLSGASFSRAVGTPASTEGSWAWSDFKPRNNSFPMPQLCIPPEGSVPLDLRPIERPSDC